MKKLLAILASDELAFVLGACLAYGYIRAALKIWDWFCQ